jgi:simple sugar transport system permease protein
MTTLFDVITVGLFAASIRLATPLAYASLGGLFSERVGIINIGLEGMMLSGAFCSVVISYFSNNHAILTIKFSANQIVSGVGINLFAIGFTAYMSQIIWGSRGASESVTGLGVISLPFLKDVPILGEILGTHSPLVYLMFLVTAVSYVILFRMPIGLRIRAVGEHPAAADSAGIDVIRVKYLGVVLSGMLAGLGGAFLSIGHVNLFVLGMTGGRGFIAMAAMIFGKWKPLRVFGASLLFGFADALQIRLQSLGILPPQIILAIPYLITIVVLAGIVGRATPPSDYKPYEKE